MLTGPIPATRKLLERNALIINDIDLVEMHEAFAAQVLCNLRGFESVEWARRAGWSRR